MNISDINMVWLSWHHAPRSRNIAKHLDISIFEYYNNKSLIKRHVFSSIWTVKKLNKLEPKVVFIHYSYLLLFFVVLFRIIMRKDYLIIADCHNKALRRSITGAFSSVFEKIKKWSFERTDFTIITNDGLIPDIKKYHNDFVILPDKIPDFNVNIDIQKTEIYSVFVSSFAVDEPIGEMIAVAKNLSNEMKLYWTGKKTNDFEKKDNLPVNIVFTGYLNYNDYYKLLSNANCIILLSTEDNCLQCGAYEGLNVGVPLVISDDKASRDYFEGAALYTKNDSNSITEAVRQALKLSVDKEHVKLQAKVIREKRDIEFNLLIEQLETRIKSKL